LPASLACATLAVADGVQIIRAHDVAETVQAVRLAEALSARKRH
jgi:dihydropteroate synthase